ncbi:cysteine sulfinate desulfinase/cysteine desulfurase [Rubidibacter lacunae KORDI 51-2]|uniref:cysteine desulfurase n=1 Tax=Rubidibacter lacunae KORDI 51-2 TaxID=582515 RepID=U5DMY2_9CHRO|nr:cysteine desulfurase family protein [Rubidibacter lacunae]ERN43026.1 cysteine sulfinate desulfinase/cysteine desulfurase [Rubidibacter lacunae KORDI 51-2]
MQIYLDHSATTPPRPEAIAKMQIAMQEQWGNPSSLHEWGQRSTTMLELARAQVAELLGAIDPAAIVFTSGGTEADNLAILGVAKCYAEPQHLIISSVEHPAVSQPAYWLERRGWQVTYLRVDRCGRVRPHDLIAALRPNTVLVSVIFAQSEVGTLQPIAELGAIARDRGVLFHADAVQAAGRVALDVESLPIDLLSVSSHKLYGPLGAGALYVRPGVELEPQLGGGRQEAGLRSGTPALPAIAGFGAAAELAARELPGEGERLQHLRDRLFAQLSDCESLVPTGDLHQRLPHHASFVVRRSGELLTGRTVVRQLNLAGIGISAGSACHSGKVSPSPILTAMGYSETDALAGIRLTLGHSTTVEDIDWTALVLKQVLKRLGCGRQLTACN